MIKTGIFIFILPFLLIQCTLLESISTTPIPETEKTETKKKGGIEEGLRKDIVQYAKKYTGYPYKYAGKGPKEFDCSGFTYFVFKNHDVALNGSSRTQATQGKKLKSTKEARLGDLVFFSQNEGGSGKINHVGLIVSNDRQGLKIIHSTSRGVVVDNVDQSMYWKSRLLFARDVISN